MSKESLPQSVQINEKISLSFQKDPPSLPETDNFTCLKKDWNEIHFYEVHQLSTPAKRLKSIPKHSPVSKNTSTYSQTPSGLYAVRRQIQEIEKSIATLKETQRKEKIIYSIQEKVNC